jgi:ABC-type transporter Mla subunit MlaD
MTRDQMDVVTDLLDRHRDQIAELTAQRDELLTAMREILADAECTVNGLQCDPEYVAEIARAAIAKTETSQT